MLSSSSIRIQEEHSEIVDHQVSRWGNGEGEREKKDDGCYIPINSYLRIRVC